MDTENNYTVMIDQLALLDDEFEDEELDAGERELTEDEFEELYEDVEELDF